MNDKASHSYIWLCRPSWEHDLVRNVTALEFKIFRAKCYDVAGAFGFVKDKGDRWHWVFIETGEWSRKSYAALGVCRRAVKMTKTIQPERLRGLKWHGRHRDAFLAEVKKRDPEYAERIAPAAPAEEKEEYWYQKI